MSPITERITGRIEREAGLPGLVDRLAGLPGADYRSLLLEATRRRAERLSPADVLRRYRDDRFVRPSTADPLRLRAVCAFHRILRGQAYDDPGAAAHFALLGLCTAGRDEGALRFEAAALAEHIGFYTRLLGVFGISADVKERLLVSGVGTERLAAWQSA